MPRTSRADLLALATFVLGCSGALNQSGPEGGPGGQGGSAVDSGPDVAPDATSDGIPDAAACDCHVENYTLTMSWACYCATFGCATEKPSCNPNSHPKAYPGCGLFAIDFSGPFGPSISVWDEGGVLVGQEVGSDTSVYQCPSDPSVQGFSVRAGRFPDATCTAVDCTCSGSATICPVPDAGVDAPTDGGVDAAKDGGPDGACSGTPAFCTASNGSVCSDVGQPAACHDGQWTCPPSTTPCTGCVGPPRPGCTCAGSSWSCSVDSGSGS